MFKKSKFALALWLLPVAAMCQSNTEYNRPDVTLSGGVGLPLANYGLAPSSVNYVAVPYAPFNNAEGGYAQPGPVFTLSGMLPINKSWFGLAATISYGTNAYNMTKQLSASGVQANSLQTTQTPYRVLGAVLGPEASFSFSRLTFQVDVDAGVVYSVSPELTFAGWSKTVYNKASQTSPAFAASVKVKYPLSNSLFLMLQAQLLYTKANYSVKVDEYEPRGIGYYYEGSSTTNQPLNTMLLNLGFGLGYRFGK